jgi:uncharacterized protein
MRIAYIDGPRLRRGLIAACEHVQLSRAELNRINVFPVPDGDTGTNLALTADSVARHLRGVRDPEVGAVARAAAEAGILGARGNCGMMFSHFLLGFAEALEARRRIRAAEFATAWRRGVAHLYHSLERPVEGTILTVMREAGEEAESAAEPDIAQLVERVLARARDSLARTPDLLPVLRAAGVVDAGAKGFVALLEGVHAYINGQRPPPPDEPVGDSPAAAARAELGGDGERYRFCTEALVRGDALPSEDEVRTLLRDAGDSLLAIRGTDVLKVHIHTDAPERVFATLRGLGSLVAHKAEDMRLQHAALADAAHGTGLARRPVTVLTDSACDLPAEIVQAHGITVVPLSLVYPDGALRDGVDITADRFVERLLAGEHPTTSQPPPAAFLDGFNRAALDGESIVAVILSGALSGTLASAEAAARRVDGAAVRIVDSRAASLLQGLLVLKAAELGELGWDAGRIAAELDRIRGRSGLFFTVDTFDRLLASGRVGRGRALLGGLLDIKPILGLTPEGRVEAAGRARGRRNVLPAVMRLLEERLPRRADVRFGIVHVACPDVVPDVRAALLAGWGEREVIVAPATPVLATHLGPGAWGVIWLREDER